MTKTSDNTTPARTTQKADELFPPVLAALEKAGEEGATLAELVEATGVRARVLDNVLYRLVKAEKARKVQAAKGKRVRYVGTEVKATRKRAPRKAAAKKTAATTSTEAA